MNQRAPISGIYAIKQRGKERYYVGQSTDIEKRWVDHRVVLRGNRHHSKFLQNAWNKAGEDAFEWLILHLTDDADELTALEQWYMDTLPSVFNARPAADSMLGFKMSDEAKEKMRSAALNRQVTPAMLAYYESLKETMRGPKPERGAAISAAKKGKGAPWSPARRAAHEARTEPTARQLADYATRGDRGHSAAAKEKRRQTVRRILAETGKIGAVVNYSAMTPEQRIAHREAHLARLDELEAAGKLVMSGDEINRRKRRRLKFLADIAELRASLNNANITSATREE